jgi:hypothetical protein
MKVTSMPALPTVSDQDTTYIVLDDLGALGRFYVEASVKSSDLESVIENIVTGQYTKVVKIVAFNESEGWSRDVTQDIAIELFIRSERGHVRLVNGAAKFVEFHTGRRISQAA